MLSGRKYLNFINAGYSYRELIFAFVRLKVFSWLWIKIKYDFLALGRNITIDYSVDISGAKFIEIGESTWIQRNCWLTIPLIEMRSIERRAYLQIGKRVQIGRNCFVAAANRVVIDDDVLLGPYVTIVDHSHITDDRNLPIKEQGITQSGFVLIGSGVWIGAGATILGHKGITIGENSVVAANTVLTKSLPANCIAVGNPARIMKKRNEE
jgi:acetyltransferase-like isoleucine patch superfamily enzyme